MALKLSATAAMCNDGMWSKFFDTIFTLNPYKIVARIINDIDEKCISANKWPLLKKSNTHPNKAMNIPVVLVSVVWALKNKTPVRITKTGVKELSIPAMALSNFSSAIQNKKAGNKLPNVPDKNSSIKLDFGIVKIFFKVIGSNSMPAATILKAATW